MTAKEKVDALILAGNTKTLQDRNNLTDVVQDLIDGYGQGGGVMPYLDVPLFPMPLTTLTIS